MQVVVEVQVVQVTQHSTIQVVKQVKVVEEQVKMEANHQV